MAVPPYGIISDLHCANWSAFSTLDSGGRNTRLMSIIAEIDRCCKEVLDAGGRFVLIGGDIFHKRGIVEPSVYNPVRECLNRWKHEGIIFYAIPGNHDLETEESTELGSSVAMLDSGNFISFSEPAIRHLVLDDPARTILFIPYIKGSPKFFEVLDKQCEALADIGVVLSEVDVICHLGIDGTLSHIPDHGASAERIAKYGFHNFFSGDYHHHKNFGNNVYSIGATTHQTWSDVGSKAGFLLVYPDRVDFRASHAPNFIKLTGEEDPTELPFIVEGHYVSAKIGAAGAAKVREWREGLIGMGAKGVIINWVPDTATEKREGVTAKSLGSIAKSVQDYCTEKGYNAAVATACSSILGEVMA